MARRLVLIALFALPGCGGTGSSPSPDPRLCGICRQVAALGDGARDSAKRAALLEEREDFFAGLEAVNNLKGKDGPLALDCPGCEKAYERRLLWKAGRDGR